MSSLTYQNVPTSPGNGLHDDDDVSMYHGPEEQVVVTNNDNTIPNAQWSAALQISWERCLSRKARLVHATSSREQLILNLKWLSKASLDMFKMVGVRSATSIVASIGDPSSLVSSPEWFGPFIIVTAYSLVLSMQDSFSVALSVVWATFAMGSLAIFAVQRLVGGYHSIASVACVLGYSVVPLLVVTPILTALETYSWLVFILKFLTVGWCSSSVGALLVSQEMGDKRVLIVYPVVLFYVYLISLKSGL